MRNSNFQDRKITVYNSFDYKILKDNIFRNIASSKNYEVWVGRGDVMITWNRYNMKRK